MDASRLDPAKLQQEAYYQFVLSAAQALERPRTQRSRRENGPTAEAIRSLLLEGAFKHETNDCKNASVLDQSKQLMTVRADFLSMLEAEVKEAKSAAARGITRSRLARQQQAISYIVQQTKAIHLQIAATSSKLSKAMSAIEASKSSHLVRKTLENRQKRLVGQMRLGTLEGLVRETTTRVDNLTARLAAVREETVEYERRSAVARSNISSLEKQAERLGMLEYKLRDRAAQAHLLIEDCDLIEARVAKLHQLQEQEERTRQMYQFLPQEPIHNDMSELSKAVRSLRWQVSHRERMQEQKEQRQKKNAGDEGKQAAQQLFSLFRIACESEQVLPMSVHNSSALNVMGGSTVNASPRTRKRGGAAPVQMLRAPLAVKDVHVGEGAKLFASHAPDKPIVPRQPLEAARTEGPPSPRKRHLNERRKKETAGASHRQRGTDMGLVCKQLSLSIGRT